MLGYNFDGTGNDINLSYFHLDTSEKDTAFSNANSFLAPVTNVFNIDNTVDGNDLGSVSANGKVRYMLDQIDLTAGQTIYVGCRLTLHPFEGLRWAHLKRKLHTNYFQGTANTSEIDTQNVTFNEESDFNGVGPIVGLDATYYVGMGFGLVGHFDTALLVGDIDAQTTEVVTQTAAFILSGDSTTSLAQANYSTGDSRRVVPVVDAKLGASYTLLLNPNANSNMDLTLEGGWGFTNYFNALDRLATNTTIQDGILGATTPITSTSMTGRSTANFALNGPYVSLIVHI